MDSKRLVHTPKFVGFGVSHLQWVHTPRWVRNSNSRKNRSRRGVGSVRKGVVRDMYGTHFVPCTGNLCVTHPHKPGDISNCTLTDKSPLRTIAVERFLGNYHFHERHTRYTDTIGFHYRARVTVFFETHTQRVNMAWRRWFTRKEEAPKPVNINVGFMNPAFAEYEYPGAVGDIKDTVIHDSEPEVATKKKGGLSKRTSTWFRSTIKDRRSRESQHQAEHHPETAREKVHQVVTTRQPDTSEGVYQGFHARDPPPLKSLAAGTFISPYQCLLVTE